MTETKAVTYFPKSGLYFRGEHNVMPQTQNGLLASMRPEFVGSENDPKRSIKTNTTLIDGGIKQLAASVARNKSAILTGSLTAADYEAGRDNIDHLTLIRLYNRLMGDQMKWFHLDEMFNNIQIDKLLFRMSFRDNPAAAQKVGKREEYDTAKVVYDEIEFDLPKYVVSWDIAIEDPLRAMIEPTTPLQQTNDYSMSYNKEAEAFAALKRIGNHYTKDASGTGKFTAKSAPADSNTKRISNPKALTAGNVHSDEKVVNEIQDASNEFMEEYDMILTHYAMSPKTAMAIAQNTWTDPNTIHNVAAYRTNGGVRQFPGLPDATAVISQMVDDNKLYAVSKPTNVLVKADGPKITKTWEDNTRFTSQTATLDFFQYKCAHEDLTKIDRKFGVIFDLKT